MESSLNLDLGELQNLLQSLTSPTIPSSNQISIPNPLPIQVQAPISIQSQDLNSQVYQQSVYNQTYHSNFHQIPTHHQYQTNSSSSSTTTTTSSSLSALLSNLSSPVNPIFSQPLPSSSSSSTNDIFNLINALQPVSHSQYYQDHHQFQSNPTTPLTAKSSISRSRDDFNQDSSTSMPCPKKLKLASPPLSPISPREDTPDLSYTHQNPIHSHFSSSGNDQDRLQSTSISPDPSTSTFKPSPPPPIDDHNKSDHENVNKTLDSTSASSSPISKDLTQLKFSQALPILTKLIETDSFLDAFQDMKEKQEEFELRLLDERNRLKNEYERNIKQAKSSGKSTTEIRRSEENMKIELEKFDQSALMRWDSLKSQQQLTLQNLGVPTFCLTKDLVILKRQHQVLEVILSSLNDRETNLNSEE